MKRKHILLLPPLAALILEILPYGAVCNFADGPGKIIRKTYSYFDLIPFGYANFGPLITAVLTCALLALCIWFLLTGKGKKWVGGLALVACVISLAPLLFGITFYSWVGAGISILLGLEAYLAK